jgi:transketolase
MATQETAAQKEMDKQCLCTIRMPAMDAVRQANSGHPGTSMAIEFAFF